MRIRGSHVRLGDVVMVDGAPHRVTDIFEGDYARDALTDKSKLLSLHVDETYEVVRLSGPIPQWCV